MSKNKYALTIGLSLIGVVGVIGFANKRFRSGDGIAGHVIPAREGPSAFIRSLRPNYPYSVIAGGAYSPGELQSAHAGDNIVRAHYADFNVKDAKLVNLTDDRFQYVSYRLNNQIYWTKKKLRIPKGELLLTDGASYARARCGNRLSETPHSATAPHEPDAKALSMPPVTQQMLPHVALVNPPVTGVPGVVTPPAVQTGAVSPENPAVSNVAPVQSLAPVEGGLTGFAPVSPGLPVVTTGGPGLAPPPPSSGKTPPTPVTPAPPSTPVATPPVTPPPTDPVPVPEPNTVYLFLFVLVLSLCAVIRMMPQKEHNQLERKQSDSIT